MIESFLILIPAVFALISPFIILGKEGTLTSLIISWWSIWLIISTQALANVPAASIDTYLIFLSFIFSVFSGAIVYKISPLRSKQDNPKGISEPKSSNLYFAMKFIVTPINLILLARGILIMLDTPNSYSYRNSVFFLNSHPSVFLHPYLSLIYNFIFSTLILTSLFIGTSEIIKKNHSKIFILSAINITMVSIFTMGRTSLYVLLIFLTLALLLSRLHKKAKAIILTIFGTSIFYIIVLLGSLRDKSLNFERFFDYFVINYHTFSFALFDKELSNPHALLHDDYYLAGASLGHLVTIPTLLLRRIGFDITPISFKIGEYLSKHIPLGSNDDGSTILANAYYSIIYPLYYDGGIAFVITFGLVYGFTLFKYSNGILKQTERSQAISFTLFYLGIFGIFMPIQTGNFWFIIFLILFTYRKKFKDTYLSESNTLST